MNPFGRIDHPVIIILQFIVASGLMHYFFRNSDEKEPIPQLIAVLAFAVAGNFVARSTGGDWFWYTDIVMFGAMAILMGTLVYISYKHPKGPAAGLPSEPLAPVGPKSPLVLFFSNNRTRFLWGIQVGLVIVLIVAYIRTYNEREEAAIAENTRVTAEFARQQHEQQLAYQQDQEEEKGSRDTLLSEIDSLKELQSKLLSGVQSLSGGVESLSANQNVIMKRQSGPIVTLQKLKRDADTTKKDVREVKRKLNQSTNEPEQPKKRNWLKDLFGRHPADVDSAYHHVRAETLPDTLVFH